VRWQGLRLGCEWLTTGPKGADLDERQRKEKGTGAEAGQRNRDGARKKTARGGVLDLLHDWSHDRAIQKGN
jgi:hypothetical protein